MTTTSVAGQQPDSGFSAHFMALPFLVINDVLDWPLHKWSIAILGENLLNEIRREKKQERKEGRRSHGKISKSADTLR